MYVSLTVFYLDAFYLFDIPSMSPDKSPQLLLPISTNGRLVWPSLCAENGTFPRLLLFPSFFMNIAAILMLRLSSLPTQPSWEDTSAPARSTSTITCSTSMSITKLENEASTTDTASNVQLPTAQMYSPLSLTSQPMRVNTCSKESPTVSFLTVSTLSSFRPCTNSKISIPLQRRRLTTSFADISTVIMTLISKIPSM